MNKEEVYSRYEINMEEYTKVVLIEARTMVGMARKDILPAVSKYTQSLADTLALKKQTGVSATYEKANLDEISSYLDKAYVALQDL